MIKFCTILIFLLLAVTGGMLFMTRNNISSQVTTEAVKEEGKALIGGDFTLVNQDGNEVKDSDFRGRDMVVFFGFTSCPDICPVTIATYGKALETLGDKAKDVSFIFITVDPETDTPEVIKNYLANIDSRIIGLTGTNEQIEKVASVYKAYFSKNTNSEGHDTVDHSGFIYLMDKTGGYIKHFPYDAPAQDITEAVLDLINKGQ